MQNLVFMVGQSSEVWVNASRAPKGEGPTLQPWCRGILLELEDVNLTQGNLNWERKYICSSELRGGGMAHLAPLRKVRGCHVLPG